VPITTNVVDPEGGWARPRSANGRLVGSTLDGVGPSGVCAVNCTNMYLEPGMPVNGRGFYAPFGPHQGVLVVSMADGSVRTVTNGITVTEFAKLLTRAGGEVITADF
jgi:hypothetical protein